MTTSIDYPLSSKNSRLVLVGAGYYTNPTLQTVEPVNTSLWDLAEALVERCNVQQECLTVIEDPGRPSDVGDALAEATEAASDALLFYYIGHGIVHTNNDLYLATGESDRRPSRMVHSSIRYNSIRETIYDSVATNKIVFLDCCFSGLAIDTLDVTSYGDLAAVHGAFVMTAASRDEAAIAPSGELHTAFTGALISLLRHGDPKEKEQLSLRSVYHSVVRSIIARNLPRPQRRFSGTADEVLVAHNVAYQGVPVRPVGQALAQIDSSVRTGAQTDIIAIDGTYVVAVPLPPLAEPEAKISQWLVHPGEYVEAGCPLVLISTSWLETELISPVNGIVLKLLVAQDQYVLVGANMVVLAVDLHPANDAANVTQVGDKEEAFSGDTRAKQFINERTPQATRDFDTSNVGVYPVKMPFVGESINEGTVLRWLKELGDQVEIDEPLVWVTSDAISLEIPSPVTGRIVKIDVEEDCTAEIGEALAFIVRGD